jgi:hypothetical protein
MAENETEFVPTNTVLEVQDGFINAASIFERIDNKLKQEGPDNGEISS